MKRFLTKIGAYLLFLAVTYLGLVFIWGQYAPYYLKKNLAFPLPGFTDLRLHEVADYKDIDVLFIGSSHAYRGFDPRIFSREGLRVFNLGSSSQTPVQSKYLIERYVDQLNPRLVVFEVYPEVFGLDGLESTMDMLSNDSYVAGTFRLATQVNHPLAYNTYLYYGMRQLVGLPHKLQNSSNQWDEYIPGGYVESKSKARCCVHIPPKDWILLDEQVRAFDHLLKQLAHKSIPVVLVRAPISRALNTAIQNHRAVDSALNRIAPIYNFNQTLQLIDTVHFYDPDHLNQKGVNLFNDSLISVLKRQQLLPLPNKDL